MKQPLDPIVIHTSNGYYMEIPNPDRRWWQFWKPHTILSGLIPYISYKD